MENKRKTLLQLAAPIFVEMLLFMLLGTADIFMLSHFNDKAAGAVGASNQLINNLNLIFAIISAGTAVLVAQNFGANKKEEIERVSAVSITTNLILGIIISISMVFLGEPILELMGVTSDLMIYASDYIKIVGGALFLQSVLNTVAVIARSHGFTKESMYITMGMNIVNILGDAIFIFGLFGAPILGAKGVAIATTFSRFCATIVALIFLFKKVLPISIFSHLKDKPMNSLKKLIKIGFPSAMENMNYSVAQTVLMSIILVNMGEISYITRTYVWTFCWFAMLFSIAIGQATQIMIGQAVGAKELDKAYQIGLKNFKISVIFATIGGLLLFFFGKSFMGLYTDNTEIIALGAATLTVDAFLEPGRTFNIVLINGLRGAGDVIFPVVMAMILMWSVAVAGGYFFGVILGFGLPGIWIGLLLDEWLRGLAMYFRWKSKKWMNKGLV
ncbi:MATE family efflux transporter [Clostridium sp. DL1XJH146]